MERDTIKLMLPEKAAQERDNRTVVYRTQAVATDHIETVWEKCLGTIINVATFVGSGFQNGTVEVSVAIKQEATSYATKIFKNYKVNLLPIYKDRRSVRVRIRVLPEI